MCVERALLDIAEMKNVKMYTHGEGAVELEEEEGEPFGLEELVYRRDCSACARRALDLGNENIERSGVGDIDRQTARS
jgi:hypothetical protein